MITFLGCLPVQQTPSPSPSESCFVCATADKIADQPDEHYDVFKDTIIRYCGYANEVGEAFRAQVNVKWVWLSYGVASAYVVADALHKGWEISQKPHQTTSAKSYSVAVAFTDTLIWQGFASVVIPGFTINRVCRLTGIMLKYSTRLPSPVRKWGTTAVGLGCIPFIIRPIDKGVDYAMDKSCRVWYGHHPNTPKGSRTGEDSGQTKQS
ncbi:mitochondrial fission process protein 1-like [Littorina saxatilis]|uniref:mitochondrial fission process protein 1-like n=1 Tax=Littorina saxatilis TaxID=31220 RepID=UPI0038B659D3